jgi:hypothetical protein
VRLNIIGPMHGINLQRRLQPLAEAVLGECGGLAVEDAASVSPVFDLLQVALPPSPPPLAIGENVIFMQASPFHSG